MYVRTFYADRPDKSSLLQQREGGGSRRGMIRPVGRFAPRWPAYGALVAGGAAVILAGCGGTGSSVTKAAALEFARAVNLRASDVPGARVSPQEHRSTGTTEEPVDLECSSRGKSSSSPVAREVRSLETPHAFVVSFVVVERSDAAAAAALAPFASSSGRVCLIRSLGATVTSEGESTESSFAVSGTSVPVPSALGPGAAALHVLAAVSHETSKGIGAETQRFLRRLERTPNGKRLAERDRRALGRHRNEKPPPFHVSLAIFRVGPADIALFTVGRSISPSLERRLLLLLHSRAVAHAL